MSAIFRIGQGGVFGAFGRARSDLLPFSVDGLITLEAQTLTHISYDWEVIGSPIDGAAPILTPVGTTCTVQVEERGGYLICLTVDAGLSSEDMEILYVGLVLEASGLPIPSEFETNQDNSPTPFDGSQGWWYKIERWMKWADVNIGINVIEGGVYVDAAYGHDLTGDGTINNPYKTFAQACLSQVSHATLAEWATPVTFYLAPGQYTACTLPQRLCMKIVGDNCTLEGDLIWGIDPELWDTFAMPLSNVPVLHIVRSESTRGEEIDSSPAGYAQGFRLINGSVIARNSNAVGAFSMPDYHLLTITGAYRDAFNIYNEPESAGFGIAIDATKNMKLVLRDSMSSTAVASYISGEVNRDMGAGILTENAVIVNAQRSTVNMLGVCRIELLDDCLYTADRTLDHAGAPYDYGLICAYPTGLTSVAMEHIRQSRLAANSFFGFNSAAAAPAHTSANALVFDRDSLLSMGGMCLNMAVSWAGFAAAFQSNAFGRGWYYGYDEKLGTLGAMRLTIPNNNHTAAARLFEHTYSIAANWKPGGFVLASGNRLTIELDSGVIPLTVAFTFNKEYVNVIGKGNCPTKGRTITTLADTVLFSTADIEWAVVEADLENLTIHRYAAGGVTTGALLMKTGQATNCTFKKLSFAKSGGGTVYAVMLDAAVHVAGFPLMATFEDCYTDLNGFLYGGCCSGQVRRCRAGTYSFAGWHGAAPLEVIFSGTALECVGGSYSFGATDVGGDAECLGSLTECTVTGYGFGYTAGGAGVPYTAVCAATMFDCTAASGRSFGHSVTGDAEASGTFHRCHSTLKSFGYSEAAAAHSGVFSGTADDCEATSNSFGSNATDPTLAEFSGVADHCTGTFQCFGARGVYTGQARRCTATYGSFGWQLAPAKGAVIDQCMITEVGDTPAVDGPPGIYGGLVRRTSITTKAGEDTPCIVLVGGTAVGNDESRIYDCDLMVTDTHLTTIDTAGGGFFDAQIAHCRMRLAIAAGVTNVLAVPYNMVDVAYDPS